MATKTEIVEFVERYVNDNTRPCPKAAVLSKFGESALDILKSAAKDGDLVARRGRNGGYKLAGSILPAVESSPIVEDAPIEAANAPQSDEQVENDNDDLSAQFAALEARLAAAEAAEAAQSENV